MRILPAEMEEWPRWLIQPYALAAGFFVSFVFAVVSFVILSAVTISILDYLWDEPYAGFICAFTWMTITLLLARSHKFLVSLLSFAAGLFVATHFIPISSYYPEPYPKAYQPTHFPIVVTCLGGLLPIFGFWLKSLRKRRAHGRRPYRRRPR